MKSHSIEVFILVSPLVPVADPDSSGLVLPLTKGELEGVKNGTLLVNPLTNLITSPNPSFVRRGVFTTGII